MTTPPSRLLLRLNADIAAEKNPFRADLFRAERAAYQARRGYSVESKKDLADLHDRYDRRPIAEMSAWISLAEGLLGFHGDPGHSAQDKLRRARALSEAAGLTQLEALSSAWLAQIDYLRLDLSSMSKNLVAARQLADQDNHSAHARAALVIAQGFHTSMQLSRALPWYDLCRKHAVIQGDDSTLSALMHNMAWIRATNMRNASLTGSSDDGEGQHVWAAAESTWSFDKLTGAANLDSYVPLLHAQILTMRGEFESAIELYGHHISTSVRQGLGRLEGLFLADLAFCRASLGQLDAAQPDATRALHMLNQPGNCDDRAPGFSRLSQVFRLIGDTQSTNICDESASALWDEFRRTCLALSSALDLVEPAAPG
jgi:hypothetical protein